MCQTSKDTLILSNTPPEVTEVDLDSFITFDPPEVIKISIFHKMASGVTKYLY